MAKKSSASAKHSHNGKSAAASTSTVASSAKSTASSRPAVLANPPSIPQATNTERPLGAEELRKMNAYWRAANYLSVGQIYLCGNPMLREPLALHNIKSRLLGHWGTTPGQNFIYVHMNRAIKMRDLNMIYIAGPGHGGPGLVANTYLEGTYSEIYPNIPETEEGLQKLFKQFSFPGGIPSHVSPECPGSIHEGGELGYSIAHAYGAAFDNPDLVVCCCVGDGESETGPLAGAWHSNKFLNPARDGVVLPILHLNGYKIANPTIPGRMSDEDLIKLYTGYGYKPYFVEGHEPDKVHQLMAATVDTVLDEIRAIQNDARAHGGKKNPGMPRWPLIILRTPKGWTGPKMVDGKPVEGTWRAHQVPVTDFENPAHLKILEDWMKSYKAEELFDDNGTLRPELKELAPTGTRRMGANPHANGGILLRDLVMPDFRQYGVEVHQPGGTDGEATRVLGTFLRDVMKANLASANFRVWGPDETASNRLDAIYEVSPKVFMEKLLDVDENISETGRVMEVLSEHMCQGWLEGYLLTGRHGFFSCYEAFVHIVDSMFNQHAKWLKVTRGIPWRRPISSLTYLLTSHVWRQDHNGFTHQDPGFIDHVVNKKADVVRVYLPPDANTLLSVADHCLRSRNYVNVIVAGKQPAPQYLEMNAAVEHCTVGIGMWPWACNDAGSEPDVVMACAGDVPTLETLAAIDLLRQHFPDIKIRFVNVVDLMTLQTPGEHPHGISDRDFDSLFTIDRPVIFAFHGYPTLIHRLTYKRANHGGLHVHGYKEEGTITTPFDMTVLNDLDRYHLAGDAIDRIPRLQKVSAHFQQHLRNKLFEHKQYIYKNGDDMPEIKNWKWPYAVTGD
jgi:xylulose-5-phosphate/fructose-6-phosphate phosphoketolase